MQSYMPLRKESYSWPSLRVCLIIACLAVLLLLQLNIENTDVSLIIPHSGRDVTRWNCRRKGHTSRVCRGKRRIMRQVTDVSHESEDEEKDHQLKAGPTFYSGFLVNTNGCRIPDLDPMDVSVQKFIYNETPIDCTAQFGPALVESNLTAVYLSQSAFVYYNVTDVSQISCCYRPFWRVEKEKTPSGDYPSNVDSSVRFADRCTSFIGSATIDYEFVKIECTMGKNSVYKDYHMFFPQEQLSKYKDPYKTAINVTDHVNVLIFGVDAVSRLNLYRQMPQTLKFLKKTLNAVEMLGYNKVEDNTFPNLIPVVTGLSVQQLKQVCWKDSDYVFDDCNFIWNKFSDLGYKTAFGEDASWMGLFHYIKRGFRKQPTDYYMRIFDKITDDDIGFDKRMNANLCIGPRKSLETLINYASKFLITMKKVLTFSFFWGSSISHDYLNLPKYGDEHHKLFLENLHNHGIFNNTVMVFMSDHGIRWGGIRGTYQGYLEERLPFLFVVYPDWFRRKYTTAVSNLKKNTHKLTTPFDLHEFLRDLTNLTQLEKEVLKERSGELLKAKTLPRGISLFLPISGNRTCSDAGIADHWCTCHQSKNISTNDSLVRQASKYLVKHINFMLHNFYKCAQLHLGKIVNAREEKSISLNTFESSDVGNRDLSVTIQTTPGNGLFEATIRHDGNKNSFTVVGTISRINLYGDQSICMPDYKLRLYCYCIHD